MQCVICKFPITGYGHNPAPIKSHGQCCDSCNTNTVIPARVNAINDNEDDDPEDGWECSECGTPVENKNDYCSQGCFNAGMR